MPSRTRVPKNGLNHFIALRKGIFHAATDTLQQRGHIHEIVRGGDLNLLGEVVQIRGERQHALARQTVQKQNPGAGEIKRQVMEDAVGFACGAHQLIQALRSAGQHVVKIRCVQANAFGFAGSAGSVDDGDEVVVAARIRAAGDSLAGGNFSQSFVKRNAGTRHR